MIRLMGSKPFHGLKFQGQTYDCGDKLGFLAANVASGLAHPELGAKFRQLLDGMLKG